MDNKNKLKTPEILKDAFWKLYSEKEISKIRISEITNLAGYNWGGFSLYFKTLYELFDVIENEVIVGFGDIDKTGYLDHLFVHADYQGKGIATAVCNQLEQAVQGDITTQASITAKPFFWKKRL